MSAKPMTRQAWLAYLKKAVDDFDWEAAGQEREWVGLTLDEILETYRGPNGSDYVEYARAIEQALKEKNQ